LVITEAVLGDVTDAEQAQFWRETLDRRQRSEQRANASLWQRLRQFFAGKMKQLRRAYVNVSVTCCTSYLEEKATWIRNHRSNNRLNMWSVRSRVGVFLFISRATLC